MRRLLLLPALALVLIGTPVLALEQPPAASPSPGPTPSVTDVPLPGAQGTTVQPGFERQVPVDASVVGVTWRGDPSATFTVETKDASGNWEPATKVEAVDNAPDPGTAEAQRAASAPKQATEPIWVKDATAVRVRLDDGTAADVKVAAVDPTPETPQPSTGDSTTSTSTTSTPPTTATPSSSAPGGSTPPSTPSGTGQEATAPPGSAGAATGWFPRIDGPQRYAFAGALFALALLLGALALGWSPWRRGGSRRGLVVLAALAVLLLAACHPIPVSSPTTGTTQPAITMRSQWGAAPPRCTNPNTDPLKFAVVHHTVNSNNYGPADSAGIVRGIQAYHENTLQYCDIAYNFLVDKYGQIFEGRWGGIKNVVLGAHTGGFNSHSTGIALIGDYRYATITSAQWRSLVHLLQWKLSLHGIDATSRFTTVSNGGGSRFPAGTLVSFPYRILGHTDLWPTECPGANVMSQLPRLRSEVQAGIVAPTTTTTTTTPPTT